MKHLLIFFILQIILLLIRPSASFSQCGWTLQSTGTEYNFYGVSFTDANTGTVVGESGTILHTTNGGVNWTSQTISGWPTLLSVCFTDANTGTAVGTYGTILRTTDGGANWSSIAPSWIGGGTINSVSFVNANIGTVVGGDQGYGWYGAIFHTTDGGLSWTDQSINSLEEELESVCFTDSITGTAVGFGGIIIRTTNGGKSWVKQSSGTTDNLWSVSFSDSVHGTIVGFGNSILHTTNGGVTWMKYSSPWILLYSAYFLNPNIGTAVGDHGAIYRTTDAGKSWEMQSNANNLDALNTLRSVYFTDSLNGIAVGYAGRIVCTHNGGIGTVIIDFPLQLGNRWQYSEGTGSSSESRVVRDTTMPNGFTYTQVQGEFFNGIFRKDCTRLFSYNLSSNNETLIYDFSKKLGDTISLQVSGTDTILTTVYDEGLRFVGLGPQRYYMAFLTKHTQSSLYGIYEITDGLGITSYNGEALSFGLTGAIINGNQFGTILGVHNAENALSMNYRIFQNYPNPFNPSTTISFSLPSKSFVTLKIFDIMGREVATLINEELSAGNHTQQWNAAGYSSGIYFYRLTTDSFIGTKKIVLMK